MAAPPKQPPIWVFPCGCVAEGSRDGPRVQLCPAAQFRLATGCAYTPKPPKGTTRFRA